MSCIYGPHQFGNEDQGWVAHFALTALGGGRLTIYGNGKQVRDVLYVEDLVELMLRAVARKEQSAGQIYNVGGGPSHTISIWAEFRELLSKLVEASRRGSRRVSSGRSKHLRQRHPQSAGAIRMVAEE